ncbi:MAG: hypothetical protein V9G29_04975 [Burkholderiaceae bacterium]
MGIRSTGPGSFFESPELVEIRRLAGVDSPEFSYLRSLEEGVL